MTLVQRSTEKPVLNTRLHNPGNKRPAVQTGTENDIFGTSRHDVAVSKTCRFMRLLKAAATGT